MIIIYESLLNGQNPHFSSLPAVIVVIFVYEALIWFYYESKNIDLFIVNQ